MNQPTGHLPKEPDQPTSHSAKKHLLFSPAFITKTLQNLPGLAEFPQEYITWEKCLRKLPVSSCGNKLKGGLANSSGGSLSLHFVESKNMQKPHLSPPSADSCWTWHLCLLGGNHLHQGLLSLVQIGLGCADQMESVDSSGASLNRGFLASRARRFSTRLEEPSIAGPRFWGGQRLSA